MNNPQFYKKHVGTPEPEIYLKPFRFRCCFCLEEKSTLKKVYPHLYALRHHFKKMHSDSPNALKESLSIEFSLKKLIERGLFAN